LIEKLEQSRRNKLNNIKPELIKIPKNEKVEKILNSQSLAKKAKRLLKIPFKISKGKIDNFPLNHHYDHLLKLFNDFDMLLYFFQKKGKPSFLGDLSRMILSLTNR
jgi:hypothetical protein